ncbi:MULTISPECIES: glycoside hydrolase family 3 N-terminal domain-containing protein [Rhodomicrobium]|uniref:glycoside hydrolase family 3 N-terminal domain-containing protein n=1 Tax=Rhodomicrobium TaxID=1068 RepID=UPI000B4A5F47|nr:MULTISPECIES: glycoside hydrolase family 3 N-terminal domain-containing protein [Rhodomicrobium]
MKPGLILWAAIFGASLAQAAALAQTPANSWRSPQGSLSEFPLLGPDDCRNYGAGYGYAECPGADERPKAGQRDAARAVRPPLPMRRSAALTSPAMISDASPSGEDQPGPVEQRLREIAGDLLLAGFEGRSPSDAGTLQAGAALKSGAIAGLLIDEGNFGDAAGLRSLTGFLKSQSETPPILLAERPGGVPPQWAPGRGFKAFPTAAEIGVRADALDAFNRYRDMAAELSSLGVNLNLGPSANACTDAEADSDDCFGSAPPHVAAFGTAFNYGHHDAHVLTALRYQLSADAGASLEAMRDMVRRLAPDALVIALPDADEAPPEYLAAALRLLREAGFDGVIIARLPTSDAPTDFGEATVQALAVGADMVLAAEAPSAEDFGERAVEALNAAVQSGRLAMPRIEDAHSRAGQLQDRLRSWTNGVGTEGGLTSSTDGGAGR